jgi:hypothetical protein
MCNGAVSTTISNEPYFKDSSLHSIKMVVDLREKEGVVLFQLDDCDLPSLITEIPTDKGVYFGVCGKEYMC